MKFTIEFLSFFTSHYVLAKLLCYNCKGNSCICIVFLYCILYFSCIILLHLVLYVNFAGIVSVVSLSLVHRQSAFVYQGLQFTKYSSMCVPSQNRRAFCGTLPGL